MKKFLNLNKGFGIATGGSIASDSSTRNCNDQFSMHHQGGSGMQEVIQMCSSFDATKSTKGASKLRRDLINAEIANLRDLLPLPSSTRQRLSQLQLMALVCVYVRKANYFQQVFKRIHELGHPFSTPNIGFSKALSGFLIMMTQNGKLLYISDNAAEYLGHSMEDLLIHGDSVYDIIDKADHGTVQAELLRNSSPQNPPGEESRLFLCRMNVSRNARRQMRFGDQKVVLLQGRYLSYLPLCSRNEPVFVGSCTPVAMPETRECVVQGATNVFTTIHAMDMKFMHVDRNGEYYLGYSRAELGGISWYTLIHWSYMREAQSKHRLISQSEQEKSCILLLRLQTRSGDWLWVHCVLQVKDGSESSNSQQQPTQSVIVATNQVLSEREASVMRANSWLYHYYTVQTKLQYGLAYPEAPGNQTSPTSAAAAAARLAAAAYFPAMNYSSHPHSHHIHHPHHQEGFTTGGGYGVATAQVQPSLHSPHGMNGSVTGYSSPYHHPHAIPHHLQGYTFEGGKESPLDFSIAAAAAAAASVSAGSIPFDFQMSPGSGATNPYGSYWAHHHHHSSNNHNQSNNSSSNYHHSHTGSHHNNHTHHHQYASSNSSGVKSESSSTVSPSATSPQTWSLSISSTRANTNVTAHSTPTSVTSNGNSSNTGGGTPRKKMKKHTAAVSEIISDSSSPPLTSGSEGGSHLNVAVRSNSYTIGHDNISHNGSRNTSAEVALTASSVVFPYHTRHRSMYKIMNSDEENSGTKSDQEGLTMSMACPLTPSPIWEGQTQRVPDLQLWVTGGGNGNGGHNNNNATSVNAVVGDRDGHGSVVTHGTDLIHCVPTYQPYLPFAPSTSGPHVHPHHLQGYGAFGFGGMGVHHQSYLQQGHHPGVDSSGSPNKENRLPPLPPTPESDNGENEENKPIKWESL